MEEKKSRTEIKKARNYANIMEAGKTLFAEKGVVKTTIKDITDYCDIGFGTFYLYFRSKEDLLSSLADELARQVVEYKTVRKMKGLSIRDRMFYGTNDMLSFIKDNKAILAAILLSSRDNSACAEIADRCWEKIYERMFMDHMYFMKKGYSREDITIGSHEWMVYNWTLKGIIEAMLTNDTFTEDEIAKISRVYADMNYYSFIKKEIQDKDL